ncbi:MAG: hypothetical protein ACLP9Y_27860 [Mycobacterium sp.]
MTHMSGRVWVDCPNPECRVGDEHGTFDTAEDPEIIVMVCNWCGHVGEYPLRQAIARYAEVCEEMDRFLEEHRKRYPGGLQ